MPVTVLDVIVIVVVLISAVLAMVRGFVREVLSVASWVAAAAAAYFFYPSLLPMVEPYFDNETVAIIVAAAAIFFVALIIASYITMKISDFVIDSRIGAFDRALGFIFGAVRGLLLMVVALWFFNFLVSQPMRPAWIAGSRSLPILVSGGDWLIGLLPKDLELYLNQIRGGDAAAAPTSPDTPVGEPDDETTPGEPGLSEEEQGDLDQLIENTDPPKVDQ
jgi:membrane protein required for colicin V production